MEDHIVVSLNGILLVNPEVRDGWFAFDPDANLFAIGENLIGIVVTERDVAGASLMVEKVEVQVRYRER